jgi:hypothetical protein
MSTTPYGAGAMASRCRSTTPIPGSPAREQWAAAARSPLGATLPERRQLLLLIGLDGMSYQEPRGWTWSARSCLACRHATCCA